MRDTIKSHADFHVTDDDPSARSAFFFVRAKVARFPTDPRIGFTATKHTFKLAVERNRAKRLLRDWVRHHEALLAPEFDYIFIARHAILDATRPAGRTAMEKALLHIMHKYAHKKSKKNAKNS
jgi:ribonuclease P protein component